MPGTKSAYVLKTPRSRALAVAVVITAAAVVLVMGREPSSPPVTALDEQRQEAATDQSAPQQAPAPRAQTRKAAASTTRPTNAASTARPTNAVPATRTRSDATTAKAIAGADVLAAEPVSRAYAVESGTTAPRVESASRIPAQDQPDITVTGCLEQDDDRFRLKETAGVEAPKSRSWRSGFLKKSAASIEVIDAANTLRLTTHVGQRVSVTGTLVDGEMQVRSLRRVAATCDEKSEA